MRLNRFVLVPGVALVLAIGIGGWFTRESPGRAMRHIESALRNDDDLAFRNWVDVDRLAGDIQSVIGVQNPRVEITSLDSQGLAALILTGVHGGHFRRWSQAQVDTADWPEEWTGPLLELMENSGPDRGAQDRFRIGNARTIGSLASIPIALHSAMLDTTLTISLRFEREERWRLVGLDNLEEYLSALTERRAEEFTRHNEAIRAGRESAVRLGEPTFDTENSGGRSNTYASIVVENLTSDTLSTVNVYLDGVTASGQNRRVAWLAHFEDIPPGESRKLLQYESLRRDGLDPSTPIRPRVGVVGLRAGEVEERVYDFTSWADVVHRQRSPWRLFKPGPLPSRQWRW